MQRPKILIKTLLATACASALATTAPAAIYLDANGTDAGFGNLAGQTWNTTNTNWTTDSTGVATPGTWNNSNGVTTFDNSGGVTTGGTVNVATNFAVDGLSYTGSTGNLTLATDNLSNVRRLTIGSSGIEVAPSRTLIIGTKIRVAGSAVEKKGSGTLDFVNNVDSRLEASSLTVTSGIVAFRNTNNFQNNVNAFHRPAIANSGQIQLFNNITATIGSLSGTGDFTVNSAGAAYNLDITQTTDATYSGALLGNANTTTNGIASLIKRGDALLRLSGALTHDGGTTVEGGTLLINTSWTQSNNGGVNDPGAQANLTVNAGTLGGKGTIKLANARRTVIGAAGKLNPGDPADPDGIGTLSFDFSVGSSGFTSNTNSTLEFALKAPGSAASPGVYDLLRFLSAGDGDVVFDANTIVSPIDAGGLDLGVYTLMRFYSDAGTTLSDAGKPTAVTSGLTLAPAFLAAYPGSGFDYGTTGEIRLNVVPEPGALASLAAGLILLAPRRRRRSA
jgi:fibronectin-binding autotransporter adhesin